MSFHTRYFPLFSNLFYNLTANVSLVFTYVDKFPEVPTKTWKWQFFRKKYSIFIAIAVNLSVVIMHECRTVDVLMYSLYLQLSIFQIHKKVFIFASKSSSLLQGNWLGSWRSFRRYFLTISQFIFFYGE